MAVRGLQATPLWQVECAGLVLEVERAELVLEVVQQAELQLAEAVQEPPLQPAVQQLVQFARLLVLEVERTELVLEAVQLAVPLLVNWIAAALGLLVLQLAEQWLVLVEEWGFGLVVVAVRWLETQLQIFSPYFLAVAADELGDQFASWLPMAVAEWMRV